MEKDLAHDRHLATGLPVSLRSWSNTLISVRQVTQRNTGRKTAGVDGCCPPLSVQTTAPFRMPMSGT